MFFDVAKLWVKHRPKNRHNNEKKPILLFGLKKVCYFCTMARILPIKTVRDYNKSLRIDTCNPLLSLVDYTTLPSMTLQMKAYSIYGIFLKDDNAGTLERRHVVLDYKQGCLLFVRPGQTVGPNEDGVEFLNPQGYALVFDPKLLHGTDLEKRIGNYPMFSYSLNEPLYMNEAERQTLLDLFHIINKEQHQAHEPHNKAVLAGLIGVVLDFCQRLYQHLFGHKSASHSSDTQRIVADFHSALDNYFNSDLPLSQGLPTVAYIAEQLHLTPNYLGDVIKSITGRSAIQAIHETEVQIAKNLMQQGQLTVNQIAYKMGFQYPHHLTRVFKSITGITPKKFSLKNATT